MTGAQLTELLSAGKTIKLGGPGTGYSGELVLNADGTGKGEAKTDDGKNTFVIEGTWQIKGDTLCRTCASIDRNDVLPVVRNVLRVVVREEVTTRTSRSRSRINRNRNKKRELKYAGQQCADEKGRAIGQGEGPLGAAAPGWPQTGGRKMATVTRSTPPKRKDQRQPVDIVGWALVVASVLIVGAITVAV